MSKVRKYGSAKDWFTFAWPIATVGAGVFGGSLALASFLASFSWLVRLLGLGLVLVGVIVAVCGIAVWRYNLKHDETPTAVVVGTATTQEDEWSQLTQRRDELRVERAGLVELSSAGPLGLDLFASTRPEDAERRAGMARAQERMRQVDAELEAIELRSREKVRESQAASAQIERELDRKR